MAKYTKKYQIYNQVTSQSEYAETWEEALTLQKKIINQFLEHTGACQITVMYHNQTDDTTTQCVPDINGDSPIKIIASIKWEKTNSNESLITVKSLDPHNCKIGDSIFIENQQDNYDAYSAVYGTTNIESVIDDYTFTCVLNSIEPTFSSINIEANTDINISFYVESAKLYQFKLQ